MHLPRLLLLVPLIVAAPLAPGAAQRRQLPPASPPPMSGTLTQVTIQRQLIIRVPRVPLGRLPMPASAAPPPKPIRWVEKKADKCIPLIHLAGAAITAGNSVDLLLNGGRRMRARFASDCPTLGFYSGFYVKMHEDGKMCAARDSIRSRSGGECRIKSFRLLVPAD